MPTLSLEALDLILPLVDGALMKRSGLADPGQVGPDTFNWWLYRAVCYGLAEHPKAKRRAVQQFAALLASYADGAYGGYGTENDEEERKAEALITHFTGGHQSPDSLFVWSGPLDDEHSPTHLLPEPLFTEAIVDLLEEALLGRGLRVATRRAGRLLEQVKGPLGRQARGKISAFFEQWKIGGWEDLDLED